jgi:hypothetical protein
MNKLLGFTLALLASGCIDDKQRQDGPAPAAVASASGPAFESRLLEIAGSYESYGRLDTDLRWASVYCRMPPPPRPRFSDSRDPATHGQKLYSLFAKEVLAYTSFSAIPSPVGQVVVKEAWVPEELKDDGRKLEPVIRKVKVQGVEQEDRFMPYARGKDGRLFHAKAKAGLFIMFKLDPKTPGTDEGWVYGTVTADGKNVTSAGRVESCMGCHKDAQHDRLFGLPEGK